MSIKWYLLEAGELQEQPVLEGWQKVALSGTRESWFDLQPTSPQELREFLEMLDLHPVQLARCLDSVNDPGVISFGKTLLMEYPTAFDPGSDEPGYLTIILKDAILVTLRHGPAVALDELIAGLAIKKDSSLRHLVQILYLILDEFADLNVEAQIDLRDELLHLGKSLADNPASVSASNLAHLRWKVDMLVSLIENQLYCISGLNASDNQALQESHRKAYIQDLLSEAEIAQRGVYRLENRLGNLYNDYQLAGSDRVEKRLRFLTIVSVITLPLGLIAGLLGMNVGGVPGLSFRFGFLVVVALMLIIAVLQYWYFRHNGWFD